MRTLNRRRRGQAAVELAVTMVVVVPLTMYVLFLQDYLSYYLDWQEAVVTSSWDFAAYDYGKSEPLKSNSIDRSGLTASYNNQDANSVRSGVSAVAQNNRYEFCDHTSAYDSFDTDYDCNEGNHHQAMAAHQCWLVQNKDKGGRQVTCFIDNGVGNLIEPINGGSINRGGLGSCTAALGAQNYFIIHNFITPGSNSNHPQVLEQTGDATTTKGRMTGSGTSRIHSNSGLGYGWIMGAPGTKSEDYFGIITDPWAVKTTKKHDPDSKTDDDFQARVDKYFNLYNTIPGALAIAFGLDLAGDDLLGYQTIFIDNKMLGDNPMTSTLAWQDDQTKDINDHYASGWNDRQESDYNARKDFYLSKEESTW